MSKVSSVFISLIFTIYSSVCLAQGQGNTPYSAFGIGELADETVASQDMMGGTGVSFGNSFYVNQLNPALVVKNRMIGGFKYVAFQVGLKGNLRNISYQDKIQQGFGMNLNNLTMAFPLLPKWAMSFSVRPYSIVEHNSVFTKTVVGSTEKVTYQYNNSGGISRFSYINSFQPFKGLFVGIEGNYNFGTIYKDTTSYLNSSATINRYTSRYSLTGKSVKAGIAYQQKLSKKWQLNVGGTYEISSTLSGKHLRHYSVLADAGNGPTIIQAPDTLSLRDISTAIPAKYKVGVSLESPFHWVFAVDYGVTQWDGIKKLDAISSQLLHNAQEINAGIEWLPNSNSTKYFNQVFYRVGFHQAETPYVINKTRIMDRSFSFGMSVPMGFRNPSYVDLGLSIGQRGVNSNGLIQENYFKVSASFSLLSAWFIKPIID